MEKELVQMGKKSGTTSDASFGRAEVKGEKGGCLGLERWGDKGVHGQICIQNA